MLSRARVVGPTVETRNDLGDFFSQLDMKGKEFDDLIIDEEYPEINKSVWWLTLARVHTKKNFSQSAFFKDMRVAWNPAQQVRFRPVGANLFVFQAFYLGNSERIMERGPWLFRNMTMLLVPYDGMSKAEDHTITHMAIWLQIHKLPDGYCKKEFVEKLIKNAGKVLEVRLQDPPNSARPDMRGVNKGGMETEETRYTARGQFFW
ncbi:hypothetical protein D1007_03539 [Hordeum vulgare]|nr:hypothetical protein D1007_03539 [Hordeum vulgare]